MIASVVNLTLTALLLVAIGVCFGIGGHIAHEMWKLVL